MLRFFSLIFGLAQSQFPPSWPSFFSVSDFQQLSVQLEQYLNNSAVMELLQDADFQQFTITDGLTLISNLQGIYKYLANRELWTLIFYYVFF